MTDSIHLFVRRSRPKGRKVENSGTSPERIRTTATVEPQRPINPELAHAMEHVRKRFEEVV